MDDGSTEVRVGFWNTWLLRPRLWAGGPSLPRADRLFAPEVLRRAPRVGAALRDRFDVMALGECFEPSEQDAVAAAWPGATPVPGPTRGRRRSTGSGLVTFVDEARAHLLHTAHHAFVAGGDRRDSDTFATKGALLVRVRVAPGVILDVVSTHLFAGGDLLPLPGADDQARHHSARMGQVDELVAFVQRERDPAAVLLLAGDFNVQAHNHDLADPGADLRDLADRLAPLQVTDLWAEHGVGPGHTCTFSSPADLPPDPAEPDQVADDHEVHPHAAPGERIDYLWLAPPADGSVAVAADRPRRWAFPGRGARGGHGGSLSDHLALTTTLRLRRHPG